MQLVSIDEEGNDVVIDLAVTISQTDPAPEINRENGNIPILEPGEALGTSAGKPTPISVSAFQGQRGVFIEGEDWSMAVDQAVAPGNDSPSEQTTQLTFSPDESSQVSGSGFMAGTRVDVWLFSEPTLMGPANVSENGDFVLEIVVVFQDIIGQVY
jgi:hypothetical protein